MKQTNKKTPKVPNWAKIVSFLLSLIGLGIMTYLTYLHFNAAESFCDLGEGISCSAVAASIYATILGIPVSVLGLLYFLFASYISLFKSDINSWKNFFLITIFVLIPSLYFTLTEFLFIKTWCVLCESAKIIMVALLATQLGVIYSSLKKPAKLITPVIFAGLVAAFVTFTIQQQSITRSDYTPLINHLNNEGWIYYKSYTCQNCARQGQTLGPAYSKLNSVECHPKGENGKPQLCFEKGITKTPTWLLEREGQEIKRLEGRQEIQTLIQESEFTGSPTQNNN